MDRSVTSWRSMRSCTAAILGLSGMISPPL